MFYKNILTIEECYRILGLTSSKKYTINDLKKIYRDLAKKYHPDKNPNDHLAQDNFLKIKEAYDFLTNPYSKYQRIFKNTELNVNININISFEEGFFGKKYLLNLNTGNPQYADEKISLIIDTFEIDIPAGTREIFNYTLNNQGLKKDGNLGDLLVTFHVRPHPDFKLHDNNVISNIRCPLSKMLRGGKINVQTMYGIKELKIPPGTLPGNGLRIPNCGVSKKHFHIVMVEPIYPSTEELKNSPEWKKFDILWDIPN